MESLNNLALPPQIENNRAHVLVFTSGKGGVGKTCVTTNVAAAMANRGAKVCIFDADTGLANINILLGLRPSYTLDHVLKGTKTIHDIVIKTDEGIAVVPGASGIAELANLDDTKVKRLCDALTELESEYDYFLIDTAAGIADSVMQFIESAPCAFLIITAEPTSLTDAFALLKLLHQRNYAGRVRAVVNQAADYPGATETFRRFSTAVDKYLGLKIEYGGFIVRDDSVSKSVALQMPVINLAGNSPASRCLYALADNVLKYIGSEEAESGFANYWKNLLAGNELKITSENESGSDSEQDDRADKNAKPLTIDDLTAKLLLAVKSQSVDCGMLEVFTTNFITAFVEQFGSFPQTFRQLFFRWLESENYAAPRLLELAGTMEALYMARYQQPLFSLEDSVARVVAQCQGSEHKLRGLINQFRAAYKQSFHVDAFDAQQEILSAIQKDDFSEEQFEIMLQQLREAFQNRFNRTYQGKSDLLLESISEMLSAMERDEQQLKQNIAAFSEDFQKLQIRKEALLSAINNAQNGTMPFNKLMIDN